MEIGLGFFERTLKGFLSTIIWKRAARYEVQLESFVTRGIRAILVDTPERLTAHRTHRVISTFLGGGGTMMMKRKAAPWWMFAYESYELRDAIGISDWWITPQTRKFLSVDMNICRLGRYHSNSLAG